jgi:hypothetical protein
MTTEPQPDWDAVYAKFTVWLTDTVGMSDLFFQGLRNDDVSAVGAG